MNFVHQADEIININTVDFQSIQNINLQSALKHVNIVTNGKINNDPLTPVPLTCYHSVLSRQGREFAVKEFH